MIPLQSVKSLCSIVFLLGSILPRFSLGDDRSEFLQFWQSKFPAIRNAYDDVQVVCAWISTSSNPTRIGQMISLTEILGKGEYRLYRNYPVGTAERSLAVSELLDLVSSMHTNDVYLKNPRYEAGVLVKDSSHELKEFVFTPGKSDYPIIEYAFGLPYTRPTFGDLVDAAPSDCVTWEANENVGKLTIDVKENLIPSLKEQHIEVSIDLSTGCCISSKRRESNGFAAESPTVHIEQRFRKAY